MDRERDARQLAAAIYAWGALPFKLWARLRARELQKSGESAALVVWFNQQAFDAQQLERAGEPEYAIRRASGAIERSPHSPPPAESTLRVAYRRQA